MLLLIKYFSFSAECLFIFILDIPHSTRPFAFFGSEDGRFYFFFSWTFFFLYRSRNQAICLVCGRWTFRIVDGLSSFRTFFSSSCVRIYSAWHRFDAAILYTIFFPVFILIYPIQHFYPFIVCVFVSVAICYCCRVFLCFVSRLLFFFSLIICDHCQKEKCQ